MLLSVLLMQLATLYIWVYITSIALLPAIASGLLLFCAPQTEQFFLKVFLAGHAVPPSTLIW